MTAPNDHAGCQICLIHPFDPRGTKVGGLETYTRDFITFHPEDVTVLLVGVDGFGDLELGKVVDLTLRGRHFKFLPILKYPESEIHEAARSIFKSITFLFLMALWRRLPALHRILKRGAWSIELRRVEFAIVPRVLGIPFIQMLHGEGAPKQPMDSLLSRYRFAHQMNERLALAWCKKFFCVNPFITERIRKQYPKFAAKVDTLTTWANPEIFKPTPFRAPDGILKIAYCGRLDLFKAPALMFETINRLHQKLNGCVEFHYVGTSNPHRFDEFKSIEAYTVMRGFADPPGIAKILSEVDAGILTSEFEGMPRFALETLSSGRPVVALDLPQLRSVIEDGINGYIVPRIPDKTAQVELLADSFIKLWNKIRAGSIDPAKVRSTVSDYNPKDLLARVYECHRQIQLKSARREDV